MSVEEGVKGQERAIRVRLRRLVSEVEARRTPRDRAYVAAIDALIPQAARIANETMGGMPRKTETARRHAWEQRWSRVYHRAMDTLAAQAGLRKMSEQT